MVEEEDSAVHQVGMVQEALHMGCAEVEEVQEWLLQDSQVEGGDLRHQVWPVVFHHVDVECHQDAVDSLHTEEAILELQLVITTTEDQVPMVLNLRLQIRTIRKSV